MIFKWPRNCDKEYILKIHDTLKRFDERLKRVEEHEDFKTQYLDLEEFRKETNDRLANLMKGVAEWDKKNKTERKEPSEKEASVTITVSMDKDNTCHDKVSVVWRPSLGLAEENWKGLLNLFNRFGLFQEVGSRAAKALQKMKERTVVPYPKDGDIIYRVTFTIKNHPETRIPGFWYSHWCYASELSHILDGDDIRDIKRTMVGDWL